MTRVAVVLVLCMAGCTAADNPMEPQAGRESVACPPRAPVRYMTGERVDSVLIYVCIDGK